MPSRKLSRRRFLAGAVAGSSAVFEGFRADARTISGEVPWAAGFANAPRAATLGGGYQFFTAVEAAFIDAAVARLIPKDDLGPGAKEAGATLFIDRQLAGSFGSGERWYMQGPWPEGTKSQGYQTRLAPAELYRAGIKAVDAYCRKTFQERGFSSLTSDEQDNVLSSLEKGEVALEGVKAETFFDLLLQNTIEGFLSDPLYGGNRDMVGWKLIGFPGARYDYRPYVSQHNQRLDLPPVGLLGRPAWKPPG